MKSSQPPVLPAFGQETAQWVLEAIEANPNLHDQSQWETVTECGTAMCVAGWAAWLHRGLLEQKIQARIIPGCDCPICRDDQNIERARVYTIPEVGQEVLGLNSLDASRLFHATNLRAVEALKFLAAGQPINWQEIYDSED